MQVPMRVLVLGAYGFFGRRICEPLARNPRLRLLLAGRDASRATALAYQLGLTAEHARRIDAHDPRLGALLRKLGVNLVIHAAGPFQGQDYHVARAAIEAGSHYLDLADGRDFVAGITRLDVPARAAQVAVVSGASTLPALSSAVVDTYLPAFSQLDTIRMGISSGALVPGMASVRAVFGYCGQPIRVRENGRWVEVAGWLDRQSHTFPRPIGERLFGRCDVPDLDLLPARHPALRTVSFHAGVATDTGHKAVEWLARQVQSGRLKSALPFAGMFHLLARLLQPLLSDGGGMYVKLEGLDGGGVPLKLLWQLVAGENHGPHIPCAPAIALANKMAAGFAAPPGAMPCMGLLTLDEILDALQGLRVREVAPPSSIR
jgi:hypothetical protein